MTGNSARTRVVQNDCALNGFDRVEWSGSPEHRIGAVKFGGRELPVGGSAVIRGVMRAVAGNHAAMRRLGRGACAPFACVRGARRYATGGTPAAADRPHFWKQTGRNASRIFISVEIPT
jgi:hypothetical protein